MSINERIKEDSLQKDKEREAFLQEQLRAVKEFGLDEKYRREFREVRARQAKLLEELRQLDVISKLEEVVEQQIPALSEYDLRQASPATKSLKQAINEFDPNKWEYSISYPTLSYQGVWNEELIFVLSRGISGDEEFISITCSPGKFLTFRGERITLASLLPQDIGLRDRMVEDALVLALQNPLTSFPHCHPLDSKGYQYWHPWELAV